jgi:hypothetical protein
MSERSRRKSCLFCGSTLRSKKAKTGARSNEHIIPEWLMDYLGIRGTTITPTVTEIASGRILDSRKQALPAFVAGTVCRACNTGWMSRLEGDAKPILTRLIEDPRRLAELDVEQRTVITRWTLKTVAVLNRASTYGNPAADEGHHVPDEHLKAVMNCEIPHGVAVVGGGYGSAKPFDWLQFATWFVGFSRMPLQPEDCGRSYKIALSLRDLLLAVVYYPSEEYRYGVTQGLCSLLWESGRHIVPVPPPQSDLPMHSNSPALEGFLRNIILLSKTWLELVGNWSNTRLIVTP